MPSRQSKLVFGLAGVLVLAMLSGLALVLANSQSSDRDDREERFTKRPQVSAALTSAVFSATSTTPEQRKQLGRRYGGETVSNATLTQHARRNNSVFRALLDQNGKLIALSAGAPPGVRAELRSIPDYVQTVLDHQQPVALSDFIGLGADGERTQAFAQPIETEFGRRILVTGFPPELLFAFLGQTLAELINITGGQAYILDSKGAVVASPDPESQPGEPVPVAGLADAVASGDVGPFGSDQYFAASPIENSTWEVVTIAPEADIFADESGWDKWMPWLLFAALALAAAAAVALVWRVLRSAGELAEAHSQLDASNQALQRRATELERSNAELDQFASIASHDLQEPLRKVQMFSERVLELDSDQLSEKGRDYLRRSADAAGRMQRLIEDLLKFSRVWARRAGRSCAPISSRSHARWFRTSRVRSRPRAAGSRSAELPTVVADEVQMRQLLQNLISNAIKFRREGVPPVVRVEGRVRGRDRGDSRQRQRDRLRPRVREPDLPGLRAPARTRRVRGHRHRARALPQDRRASRRHDRRRRQPGEGSTFTVRCRSQRIDEPRLEPIRRPTASEREAVACLNSERRSRSWWPTTTRRIACSPRRRLPALAWPTTCGSSSTART